MRMTLLSPLAFGAMIFAVLAEPVVLWAAEPAETDGRTDGRCHSGRRRRRSWRFGHCGRLRCRHLYQYLDDRFQHA